MSVTHISIFANLRLENRPGSATSAPQNFGTRRTRDSAPGRRSAPAASCVCRDARVADVLAFPVHRGGVLRVDAGHTVPGAASRGRTEDGPVPRVRYPHRRRPDVPRRVRRAQAEPPRGPREAHGQGPGVPRAHALRSTDARQARQGGAVHGSGTHGFSLHRNGPPGPRRRGRVRGGERGARALRRRVDRAATRAVHMHHVQGQAGRTRHVSQQSFR